MTYAQTIIDRNEVSEAVERETLEQNVDTIDTETTEAVEVDTDEAVEPAEFKRDIPPVTVDKKKFQSALMNLSALTRGKKLISILGSLRIESTGTGELRIEATDLDVGMRFRLATEAAPLTESAVTATPLKPMLDMIRGLKDQTLTIRTDDQNVIIEHAHGAARFVKDDPGDFPIFVSPEVGATQLDYASISASELSRLVERTKFAVSTEDSKYTFTGALMVIRESGASMVATDGHRLVTADTRAGESVTDSRFLVPKFALKNLSTVLKKSVSKRKNTTDADVSIERWSCSSGKKIAFSSDNWTVVCSDNDGLFPDYERVIPKTTDRTFKANGSILDAITRVNGGQKSYPVANIKIQLTAGLIEISTTGQHDVQASELLEISWGHDDIAFGVNPHYLMDFLKTVKDEEITWQFCDGESSAMLRARGSQYVVMPIRL